MLYEDKDAVLFVRADDRKLLDKRDRGELQAPAEEVAVYFQ